MDPWKRFPKSKNHGKHRRLCKGSQDDDYDDTPLFTRDSSYKLIKQSLKQDQPPKADLEKVDVCLPYLYASLFATILEETVEQLRILDECNNELRIINTLSNKDFLLREKFSVALPTITDELTVIDVKSIGNDVYKLNKLAADRKYCKDLFLATYMDLALRKHYDTLYNANIVKIQQKDRYNCLLEEEIKNKLNRRELLKQIRQLHNHNKTILYDTDRTIEDLRSKLEDLTLVSEIESRYIRNWQLARYEQNIQRIMDKEAGPSNNIKYYRARHEHESRVHSEIELLTNIFITDTLTKVEHWMDKFDRDMEKIDLKIQVMKNQHQSQYDKRIEIEQTLEIHAKDIDAWVNFKDEREKARLYNLKMTNAAIAVQSWWRGLLVRLQMGPFKPVKRKGAPAPKEKKKK